MLIATLTVVLLSASAQQVAIPREISNRVECRRCAIRLTQVVVIGGDEEGLIEWPTSVSEDRHGRYYVTQPNKREAPAVFNSDGRRHAVLGRLGEGPGEFRTAAYIVVDPADTVFVADWGNRRLSVFSPQFRFVRSFSFPSSTRALAVLPNGDLVAMATARDRGTVGLPFHIFRRDGQRASAVGDRNRPYLPSRSLFFIHRITPARRDGFWAVPLYGDYTIEHWTTRGIRDVYLKRTPDWFAAMSSDRDARNLLAQDPPPSSLVGIAEDASGLLWVVSQVADPRRRQAPLDTIRTPEGSHAIPQDADRVWDSVVEVIDPRRGVLVVARRFDELFHMVLPSGKVVHVHDGGRSGLTARVLKLSLLGER